MAFFTIRNSIGFKLAEMHIFMTIGAIGSYTGKFLVSVSCLFFIKMAVAASLFSMSTFEFKLCFLMIKFNIIPFAQIMAGFAICFRIVFVTYKGLMNVLMAVLTAFTNFFKFPFLLFFMTGKTRRCQVCSSISPVFYGRQYKVLPGVLP